MNGNPKTNFAPRGGTSCADRATVHRTPEGAFTFDHATHTYTIDGRRVPSVTQVLNDVVPGWQASEWHLQRGQAVHACCAILARGEDFDIDLSDQKPEDRADIEGRIDACRKFFAEVHPEVMAVEQTVYSTAYQYAGTFDLMARIQGTVVMVDYKSTLTPTVPIQIAAYAHAHSANMLRGLGVELREDGTYRMSEIYDLRKPFQKWLAVLTAYGVRRECGVK